VEFNTETPTRTALYLVDRGMQGKYYRYYNADTDKWGACGSDMNDALRNKDNHSTFEIVGFFPWVGPLTGPKLNPDKEMEMIVADAVLTPKVKVAKTKTAAKVKVAKVKVEKKTVTKAAKRFEVQPGLVTKAVTKVVTNQNTVFADGTIFYRADREKWVAMWNNKQEAARDSIEACQKFLLKKYGFSEAVVIEVK
jgi:hypothetical protein